MLHQFNKIVFILFIFVGVFSSCSDEESTEKATAITILSSDYSSIAKVGTKATFNSLDNSQINTFPTSGENQVWDLNAYKLSNPIVSVSRDNLPVPAGTSFTSATFVRTLQSTFISAFTYTEFYELSEGGYYIIGNKVTAGTANLGGGTTLTTVGKEVTLSPKLLIFKFPMNYNDITEQTGVLREGYSLTAPAFGLSNAPVERQLTYPTKSEVVGWGKVMLPQGAITTSTDVLVVKNTETTISNYFLNGSTAPAALTSALGLVEGQTSTIIFYYFISKEFGIVAVISFNANSNGGPVFPAAFASYTVSRK